MSENQTPQQIAEEAVVDLLTYIGEDPRREGLLETPRRYAKFLKEFTSPPNFNFTTFTNEGKDGMVVVGNIPFYSLCEHHLAPFFGEAYIAYIPSEKIVGLSKIPRLLDMVARKPQNQERITSQVAMLLQEFLEPKGVGVIIQARHLCVEMRGVEKPGTITTTSTMIGCFEKDFNCRQEFLKLIKI